MPMRLIDAYSLMETIKNHHYLLKSHVNSTDYGMFTIGIQQAVDEQSTIDAVPVVRCKDCKYWDYGDCYRLELSRPDDFCSYGELREEIE